MRVWRGWIWLAGSMMLTVPVAARSGTAEVRHLMSVSEDGKAVCRTQPLRRIGGAAPAAVRKPGIKVRHLAAASTWEVEYVDFTPEAQAVFQRAVEIWSTFIASPVEIKVYARWEAMEGSALGYAGPWEFFRLRTHPEPIINQSYLPSALFDALVGEDGTPGEPDIEAAFNSNYDGWYFGLDGSPAFEEHDFLSVVLHEIGHGLGFLSSISPFEVGQPIVWGLDSAGTPVPFDYLIMDGLDRWVVDGDLENGSPEFEEAVTSQHLFAVARNAVEAAGGDNPELYAPSEWNDGSSVSHLDEFVYGLDSRNALMTPTIYNGEAQHHPGPVMLGIMRDIGWTILDPLYFAQFADGAGIQSDLVLTNPSNGLAAVGVVTFRSLDGSLLDEADFLVDPDLAGFVIPPLGSVTLSTFGQGSTLVQGSVVVQSDQPLFGVLRFDLPGTGVAGVGSSKPGRAFVVPVRRQGELSTGAAVSNLSPREISVQFRLLQSDGAEAGVQSVTIPGFGRASAFIQEYFGATVGATFVGSLEVSCHEADIAVLGLELEVGKRFTTLPVTPLRE